MTDTPLLLVPIEAKLSRAHDLLVELNDGLYEFRTKTTPPVEVRYEFADDRESVHVKAYKRQDTPLIYSIMAGEIVHHARSSLDHLVAALAARKRNEVLLSHQFPICPTKKKFDDAIKANHCRGIGEEAINRIEAMQPYNNANPQSYTLELLRYLDNTAKHRSLLVTSANAMMKEKINIGEGDGNPIVIKNLVPHKPDLASENGTTIFSIFFEGPTDPFVLSPEVESYSAFAVPDRVRTYNVVKTLQTMVAFTKVSVRSFQDLLAD